MQTREFAAKLVALLHAQPLVNALQAKWPDPGSQGPEPPKSEPGAGDPRPPGRAPRRSLVPWWLVWVLLVAAVLWNAYVLLAPQSPPRVTLPYSAFVQQVRAGNVAAVTMDGQHIDGILKQPVAWAPDELAAPPTAEGTAAPVTTSATPALGDTSVEYTSFTAVLPASGDDRLLPLLEQHGVTVTAKESAGWSLVDVALTVLPTLILIGLLVMMSGQFQRGQQSALGFGGSRARLYSQERPGVTLADVAGAEEAKAELREIVQFLRKPDQYRKLGARLPRGVLLVGPPGTGKTLLARAVAGEAEVPFFSISASEFVEMFVGVGASRVRDLFAKAKKAAPAIVFVDELDAVGRQRGTGLGGGNDEREQTLNQLLVEMDGFDEQTNVIVLAATNRPDVLDPALLRRGRFDRQVMLGLPDRAGREAILRIYARRLLLGSDVDLPALARGTAGFSGADLANLANEAALVAARRGASEVGQRDFDEAVDKIVLGTRQGTLIGLEERRLVAYHEGGHALVAKLTPGGDPVNKVTIIPHGLALGATRQSPEEDRHTYLRDYLIGRLEVMLGGRAAEELVFGQPTTGAESDLKQATGLARRMVGLWGMSDELGPVSYSIGETHPFLGRELSLPREYAEATATALDGAVRRLIEKAHRRAYDVLLEHRSALDALAAELLAHETVEARQLDALLAASRGATAESGVGAQKVVAAL